MRRSAYTIIELLLVMQIISILTGLAIQQFSNTRQQARISTAKQDISRAARAIEQFRVASPVSDGPIVSHTIPGLGSRTFNVAQLQYAQGPLGVSQGGFSDWFNRDESFTPGAAAYAQTLRNVPSGGFVYYYNARALTGQATVGNQSLQARPSPFYNVDTSMGAWSLCASYEQAEVPRYFAMANGIEFSGVGSCQ